MVYSGYRVVALTVYTVMVLVLGAIIAAYHTTWGVAFIVVFLVVGIPVLLLTQRTTKKRVDDSGGEFPMQTGGLGMMERDIADDRWGDLTVQDREELGERPP
jgi:Flp pilus assembly protein TadB